MSKTTAVLTVIYICLVAIVILSYSPHGARFFMRGYAVPRPVHVLPEKNKVPGYVGELIEYDIKMGPVKIGSSIFLHKERTSYNGQEAALVTFTTDVTRIHDTELIWADAATFLPLKVERDVRVWPRKETILEVYDQARSTLDITKLSGASKTSVRIVKKGHIHNAVLLPYQLRRFKDIPDGWSMQVVLPTQEFKIQLAGIQDVQVPAGSFRAYYFRSEPPRFEIWVSADERRIPVKIKGSSGLNYTMLMRSYREK